MNKKLKKFLTIAVAVCFMLAFTFSTYADALIYQTDVNEDTSHGRYIACNSTNTYCLNVYTSGTPTSTNRVTTWKTIPGDKTQYWEML